MRIEVHRLRPKERDGESSTNNFLLSSTFKFVYEDYNYSLVKPDPCFLFESLAVQDYNKKVPDE